MSFFRAEISIVARVRGSVNTNTTTRSITSYIGKDRGIATRGRGLVSIVLTSCFPLSAITNTFV